ncbi:MGMT family protein [Fimbriimonas ginsengisoli]|uniref:Methylated-DNA--[protein]-cysteine S-methyltransferase n=1 Tax=Fimbriimonas ginsengisoli Gsoil 348 TaxID=661478 RepID=A0A068NSQ0_FIMGI|nr:MGMT family protein [Fimbriimonas ginsengisoli]AIE86538.1 methylated-DNA--[protein]-cysteine S-methyltransferase [Fimbriimonas ginsengisoli Gsoil 348]
MDELWELVKKIPRGRVAAYGALGAALSRPVSGYLVGRMMANCPPDVPWWRVVDRHGKMVVAKRDPVAAETQRRRLENEKTEMADEDTVSPSAFIDPDLL